MADVRWALIGCGDIARRRVAPALAQIAGSELTSVCRARTELAQAAATELGAKRWYSDWRDAVRDPEINAVYIATPVHVHRDQAVAAAEAGKHVLCEKPMAMDVAQCADMLAAAKQHGVKLGVAYYRHFYPVLGRIREILASKELGEPVLVQVNAFEWFNPPADHPRAWLLDPALSGGGPMFDFGCHRIEILCDLFGPVRNVKSMLRKVHFTRAVEDTGTVLFEFATGVCGTLAVTHASFDAQDTVTIFCTKGSLHVPALNGPTLIIKSEAGEKTEALPPAANIHQPLIEDFVQAVVKDRQPVVDGEIGRMVAEVEASIFA